MRERKKTQWRKMIIIRAAFCVALRIERTDRYTCTYTQQEREAKKDNQTQSTLAKSTKNDKENKK